MIDLARLKAAAAQEEMDRAYGHVEVPAADLLALVAEVEALRTHGGHLDFCVHQHAPFSCVCGLDNILAPFSAPEAPTP